MDAGTLQAHRWFQLPDLPLGDREALVGRGRLCLPLALVTKVDWAAS